MSRKYTRNGNGISFVDTEHFDKVSKVKFINKKL